MNRFCKKLKKQQQTNHSLLCIGLDTDRKKIPAHLLASDDPVFEFNKAIIDTTADLVCAYKPNSAFYEAEGAKGLESLKKTCDYIHQQYPAIPIILDAKRADIDSTNQGYIRMAFDYLKVEAMTLHPYLGKEALTPFLSLKDKFFFILCRTSNPGAGEFQDLTVGRQKLYEVVAQKVVQDWNTNNNCGLVIGATYPDELAKIRKTYKDVFILIPGLGSQGGDAQKTIKAARKNFIINVSRDIIYAGSHQNFQDLVRQKAKQYRALINKTIISL